MKAKYDELEAKYTQLLVRVRETADDICRSDLIERRHSGLIQRHPAVETPPPVSRQLEACLTSSMTNVPSQLMVINNTDARGSHFTEVGRDVVVNYCPLTIRFVLSMFYWCVADLDDGLQQRKRDDSVSLCYFQLAAFTYHIRSILVVFLDGRIPEIICANHPRKMHGSL